MATDLDEMLGTEDDEEQPSKPKPPLDEEEESLAPVVGAPTAHPLIPPPSASAIPAPSLPNAIPAGGDAGLGGIVGAPAQPAAPQASVASPMDKYNALHAAGAPVSHKTGIGGGILKGLDIAGNIIVPGVMANIPGTTMHQRFQEQGALNQAKNQMGAAQEQATLEKTKAETGKAVAETAGMGAPKPKEEEWSVVPGIQGPNGEPVQQEKNSGQVRVAPLSGASLVDKTKTPAPSEAQDDQRYEKIIGDQSMKKAISPEDQAFVQAYEKRKGLGAAAAADNRAPERGTWMPLYGKDGQVVGSWNPATGEQKGAPAALPGTTAAGATAARGNEAATQKQIAPFESVVTEAETAQSLKDAADKGNAEADVGLALSFFKAMRAGASGGSSGIRFTQQENNLIMGARSLFDSLQVAGNKVFSHGEPLSKTQRAQIMDVINIYKTAAQRHIDQIKGGGGTQGGEAAGGKTYTDAEVQAAAQAHGMKPEDVEKAYKDKGYTKKTQ